jgi:hypothetical protein
LNLLKAYERLYSGLVDWGLRTHGPEDLPQYNAILGLSSVATMNLCTLNMLCELVGDRGYLFPDSKPGALLVWVGFVVLHAKFLIPSSRDPQEPDPNGRSKTKSWIAWGYMGMSVLAFLMVLSIRRSVL